MTCPEYDRAVHLCSVHGSDFTRPVVMLTHTRARVITFICNSADAKWRFMWRVGPRPAHTAFPELNAEPVVPKVRRRWGHGPGGT